METIEQFLNLILIHIFHQIINPALNDIAQIIMLLTAILGEIDMTDAPVYRIRLPIDKANRLMVRVTTALSR